MLFPMISLGLLVSYLRNNREEPTQPPVAPDILQSLIVDAWTGTLPLAVGGELRVSLTRLHGAAHLQEFDMERLGERFSRDQGEPWRMEMAWDSPDPLKPSLALCNIRVMEGEEPLMLPLIETVAPAANEVVDPIALLFSVPKELRPGELLSFVLWGPMPREDVSLHAFGQSLTLQRASIEAPTRGSLLLSLASRENDEQNE
ncbi:MAG: hypothetical protein ACI8X5_000853 [Planctomycetota bacterium]|jgi:hypothetical protein